jgi:hypothetical protein
MSAQFLKRLIGRLCPHRFSWPHSGLHGQDYQVCLICGTAFGYDWINMHPIRMLSSCPGRDPSPRARVSFPSQAKACSRHSPSLKSIPDDFD